MASLALPELKKRIGRRQLSPLHVFVGDDSRLIERIVHDVEATVDDSDRPFAVERVYAGEPSGSPMSIASAARTFPMLGDRRIVIVLRAERLLKPKRASRSADGDADDPSDEDADASTDATPLEDYVADPAPSTTVVFVATEVDRTRRLTKKVLAAADVTEFAGFEAAGGQARAAAAGWVRAEFERIGRPIEPAAVQMLIERAGGEVSKLRGDVERLLLYAGDRPSISRDDVAEVVAIATDVDDWAVVNAIAEGETGRALQAVADRLDRGDSPHGVVGQLRWWVSQRLAEADPGRVPAAIDALLRTDLALKSSGGDDRVLVERLVVELTGRPVARRGGWGGRR
ncbi:MAG TPA: DNA polymerase III subunit delta [Vicinamibacterales bacterium]|nr:DNA polymerase III subunit delta [Vicinamibacterales bacterium]